MATSMSGSMTVLKARLRLKGSSTNAVSKSKYVSWYVWYEGLFLVDRAIIDRKVQECLLMQKLDSVGHA